MSKIKTVYAREILASGGAPSLEVTVITEGGAVGEASVSYGASAGTKEATVLLDGDKARFNGKGMLTAIKNINEILGPAVMGMEVTNQIEIDEKMIAMDGTENKAKLGGNAILGVSMAVARAGAVERKLELYEYLQSVYGLNPSTRMINGSLRTSLPKPMIVMIEGGKHADETTDLQEFCVSAMGDRTATENVRMEMEIYEALKKILKREKLSINVGNEGAFAPNGIPTNEAPLNYLVEAITAAGYVPGVDAGISIDAAASEFQDVRSKIYDLRIEQKKVTSEELIEYYAQWMGKYPFVSWEDMLSEFDWESWPKLLEKIGGKFPLIADDLTVTNTKIWREAIEKKAANAILIKLNQAGSVTETINCCKLAKENSMWTVVSHRGGGETNDTFMVDLAVAVGSEYIKAGPTRGERVCKYNRLMRIEEQLNKI
ncbi:phosphopyruvate hydratase [Candidatus Shapirobacteria bacterium]|nr:phosphopyruvate hydratase [Candidatus Shapirobacteria bacterium]